MCPCGWCPGAGAQGEPGAALTLPTQGPRLPKGARGWDPQPPGGSWAPRAGRGAHVELALHGGLVDPGEGTVFSAVTAGEIEELPEGLDAGPGVPRALHGDVLAEVWGRCRGAGRLIQGRQGQRAPVAAVVAGVTDQEARAGLQEDGSSQSPGLASPLPSPQDASPPAPARPAACSAPGRAQSRGSCGCRRCGWHRRGGRWPGWSCPGWGLQVQR